MTKLSEYKIANTIRGKLSRKEYWARRAQLRAAYKAQKANASNS